MLKMLTIAGFSLAVTAGSAAAMCENGYFWIGNGTQLQGRQLEDALAADRTAVSGGIQLQSISLPNNGAISGRGLAMLSRIIVDDDVEEAGARGGGVLSCAGRGRLSDISLALPASGNPTAGVHDKLPAILD